MVALPVIEAFEAAEPRRARPTLPFLSQPNGSHRTVRANAQTQDLKIRTACKWTTFGLRQVLRAIFQPRIFGIFDSIGGKNDSRRQATATDRMRDIIEESKDVRTALRSPLSARDK